MATSWPVIALVITQVGHDWGLFTIAADLPKYFASVIHFSVHSASINLDSFFHEFYECMPFALTPIFMNKMLALKFVLSIVSRHWIGQF
jgi:hypothetical protein